VKGASLKPLGLNGKILHRIPTLISLDNSTTSEKSLVLGFSSPETGTTIEVA